MLKFVINKSKSQCQSKFIKYIWKTFVSIYKSFPDLKNVTTQKLRKHSSKIGLTEWLGFKEKSKTSH